MLDPPIFISFGMSNRMPNTLQTGTFVLFVEVGGGGCVCAAVFVSSAVFCLVSSVVGVPRWSPVGLLSGNGLTEAAGRRRRSRRRKIVWGLHTPPSPPGSRLWRGGRCRWIVTGVFSA